MSILRPNPVPFRLPKGKAALFLAGLLGLLAVRMGLGQNSTAPATPASGVGVSPAEYSEGAVGLRPAAAAGSETRLPKQGQDALATQSAPATPASAPASAPTLEPIIPMPQDLSRVAGPANQDTGKFLSELAVRMVVVLALAVAAILVVKRLLPRLARPAALGRKQVKVLETTYLGPKKALHVVQVGSKTYLLAGCGDSVRFMTEVTDALKEAPREP